MDELLKEAAKQIPALAVLCWLTAAFLRAQREFLKSNQDIAKDCHQVQRDTNASLDKVKDAIRQVRPTSGGEHGRQ